jgi:hypothetical protein
VDHRNGFLTSVGAGVGIQVYDVSRYAEEHPGGDQVLFAATGKSPALQVEDIISVT